VIKIKSISAISAILLGIATLASCATAMSNGIDGSEPPLLPAYRSEGTKTMEMAISARASASTLLNNAVPLTIGAGRSFFTLGDALFQWQPEHGKAGFCGAMSVGGWAGYTTSPLSDDKNWEPKSQAISYGMSAALRLGLMTTASTDFIYAPSAQFRYAYEGGPYADRRAALAAPNAAFDIIYLNRKTSRHSWLASIVPIDASIPSPLGDFRVASDFGWNERWYSLASTYLGNMRADPDSRLADILVAALPTDYGAMLTFRFRGSGWYLGANVVSVFDTIIFSTFGISLGAGYSW
jgi:hypothetical protein